MSIIVVGAVVGLIILVMSLAGAKMARQALTLVVVLTVGALLAIWWFLYRVPPP